jgi:hypothetical protein
MPQCLEVIQVWLLHVGIGRDEIHRARAGIVGKLGDWNCHRSLSGKLRYLFGTRQLGGKVRQ